MTETNNKTTLLQCFQHWEATIPDNIYLTQPYPVAGGGQRVVNYSWQQVGSEARRMARHLRSLKLQAGSSIGIVGKNSAHWIMADLAIWMAGFVSVPLYPTLNADTAGYILDHADIKLLFVGKLDGKIDGWHEIKTAIPESMPLIGLPMSPRSDIPQWDELISNCEPLKKINSPKRDELVTIAYTSGSTGRPKGVMHSYGSMTSVAVALSGMFSFSNEDRMLSYLPLAHVAERAAVEATSLYFGFHVFFGGDLSTFQNDLKRAQPTIFFSVPRLWTKFNQAINGKLSPKKQRVIMALPVVSGIFKNKILTELGLNHVRAAITGSAPLPESTINWYRELGLELLDCYGMSENFGVSHASRPGEVRVGYVGQPVPGVECRIAESGEIEVKSPGQMLGYYKMPEKSAADLTSDGFFKTGDRGETDSESRLKITGRVKELFKTSKGKYIAPVPIEQKLGNHPGIEVSCVTGPGQPQPFALLMLSEELRHSVKTDAQRKSFTADLETLLEEVNATVEEHEKMDYLVVVKNDWTMDNGYLTPTMKIKREVIESHYLPQADDWVGRKQKVVWEL